MTPVSAPPLRRGRRARRRGVRLVSVGALVALTAGACGAPLPKPEPGANPAAYSGLAVDADRIDYAIGKLSDIVDEELEARGVPGAAVAVVHDGEVAAAEGFGVRSSETDDEVDADTVFGLSTLSASVSATVVAAAAEQDEDAVGWSTPVQEQLPWFALSDPAISPMVTVGDLFAHRSGLPAGAGDDLAALGHDRPTVLHGLRHLPLDGFRSSYAPTDFGLTAGAEAVTVAAGLPWAELAEEGLFDPLDMERSSYSHEEFLEFTNRAENHIRGGDPDGTWVPAPPGDGEDVRAPAGGLSSSVNDMARWMTMVLDGGEGPGGSDVVPADALREALTPQATASPPDAAADRTSSSGYGFSISDSSSGRVQWEQPATPAQRSGASVLMMPSLDLGLVTLTNAPASGAAETITSRFADLAQYGDPAVRWGEYYDRALAPARAPAGDLAGQTAPTSPQESRPLDELVGTYENDYFGPVRIGRDGDELLLEPGPDREPWRLEHWDGDTFAASPAGGDWPAGTRGSVTFDDDEVTLDLLDSSGLGTFTRVAGDEEGGAEVSDG